MFLYGWWKDTEYIFKHAWKILILNSGAEKIQIQFFFISMFDTGQRIVGMLGTKEGNALRLNTDSTPIEA